MWQQRQNRENFVLIKSWWITYDVQRVYREVTCSEHYHNSYEHFWRFSSCTKLADSCWIWLPVAKIYFVYGQKRKNSFRFSSKVQLKKRAKAGVTSAMDIKFTSIIAKLLRFYITMSWNRIWSPKNPHDLKVGDCHQNKGKPKEEKGEVKKFLCRNVYAWYVKEVEKFTHVYKKIALIMLKFFSVSTSHVVTHWVKSCTSKRSGFLARCRTKNSGKSNRSATVHITMIQIMARPGCGL